VGAIALLSLACGSSRNAATNQPTPVARASVAATNVTSATSTPGSGMATTPATAVSPAASTVAMTFSPPGGSAPWSNVANGCHGVPLPPGAEQPKASDTGVTATEIKLGSTFALTGSAASYLPIIKTIQDCFAAINDEGGHLRPQAQPDRQGRPVPRR